MQGIKYVKARKNTCVMNSDSIFLAIRKHPVVKNDVTDLRTDQGA